MAEAARNSLGLAALEKGRAEPYCCLFERSPERRVLLRFPKGLEALIDVLSLEERRDLDRVGTTPPVLPVVTEGAIEGQLDEAPVVLTQPWKVPRRLRHPAEV